MQDQRIFKLLNVTGFNLSSLPYPTPPLNSLILYNGSVLSEKIIKLATPGKIP